MEQALYFDFTADDLKTANQFRTIKAKVSFLLMLGYFKAKQQCYHPELAQNSDVDCLLNQHFPDFAGMLSGKVDALLAALRRTTN